MAITNIEKIDADSLLIEQGLPEDDEAAEALWARTGARACTEEAPSLRLIARDAKSHRFLGVADFFRTFPPEDALFAVAVVPSARRRGVGTKLLRALAAQALERGKRNLAAFIADDDIAALQLLRSAAIPMRLHQVEVGLYVELDLTSLLRSDSFRRSVKRRTTSGSRERQTAERLGQPAPSR